MPDGQRSQFGDVGDVPGERADIVLLLRQDDDGTARVLGIPRDLVLYRDGRGPERVAQLLGDGPGQIADAVCHSLGIGVDHLAVLHFTGLQRMVDLAGGVDVTSDAVLADANSGLLMERGTNHMDGARALAYVRARNIFVQRDGGFFPDPVRNGQRSERAIEVIDALGRRLDVDVLHPIGTQRLAWTAAGAVTVDSGSTPLDLLALADAARAAGRAVPRSLPVRQAQLDPVPIQELGRGAKEAVERFTGPGRSPAACSQPALFPPSS